MILQIDDHYFNPLQITVLTEDGPNVRMYFSDSTDDGMYCVFKNWKVSDLAAEINRCIKEF